MRELESANLRNKIVRAASNKRRKEQKQAELNTLRSHQTSVATTSTDATNANTRFDPNESFILVTLPIFSTGIDNENEALRKQNAVT